MSNTEIESILSAIITSPKYKNFHPGLIERIAKEEILKGRKKKDTIKAIKNKLHQVGGAYLGNKMGYQKWFSDLKSHSKDPETFKSACRQIIKSHASTNERLPILEEFYSEIFSSLPPIYSILDVACGLNPLTIPWMNLAPGTQYHACDIYSDMISFLGHFFTLLPVKGNAFACDVIGDPPTNQVDLALILKTIPCLEQVDKQAGKHLTDSINARHILISFPSKSLGGRDKGMKKNYEQQFYSLAEGKNWDIKKFLFETELAFLIHKK